MSRIEPQFLEVGRDDGTARRIAYLTADAGAPGKPCLAWLPGFHSDMTSIKATALADWAARSGHALLRFDYTGHGLSEGDFADGTIGLWLEDTLAALGRAPPGPKLLVASSMGAWIALLALRRLRAAPAPKIGPVSGAVLIAPAWDMTEALLWQRLPADARAAIARDGVFHMPSRYGDGPYPITRQLIEDGRTHLLASAPFDPGCPIHILHGMCDPDVPWRHSLALMELLRSDDIVLTLVKDGDHRLSRPEDIERLLGTVGAMSDEIGRAVPPPP